MSTSYDLHILKELLATTLREKPDSYVFQEIFSRFVSFQELFSITQEELLTIKGIGPVKAKQIISALQLAKMIPIVDNQRQILNSPNAAFNIVKDMQFYDREHFVVLGLDIKNQLVFRETVSIGSLSSSIVHPREVFKTLIRRNCASALLCHNHPSGNPEPSPEDLSVTKRLVDAGDILCIQIIDHIIVGHSKFISFKERGCL